MLNNLTDLVKSLAGNAVINNPDIPNDKNNAVVAEATHTVASGFQNMVAGGGLQNIISMFSGGGNNTTAQSLLNNPIVNMMIGHFSSKLMSKFGLNASQASSASTNLIPSVMSDLVNKTNDPNNSDFTLDHLLASITGGQSNEVAQEQMSAGNSGFNFQSLINQFTGGGGGNSGGGSGGGSGIMDLVSKITSGAQNAQQQQGGGGLMDMIKGFF